MSEVPRLLSAIEGGDPSAAADLLPLVYDELRKLAARRLAQEKSGQTLDATALVHEAYLRLVGADEPARWNGRGHFFAAAAEAMRRILIDLARRKQSHRRGADRRREPLDEDLPGTPTDDELLDLDEALSRLAEADPQAAEALGISSTTADRYWAYARAWLHAELKKGDPG